MMTEMELNILSKSMSEKTVTEIKTIMEEFEDC